MALIYILPDCWEKLASCSCHTNTT